MTSQDLSVCGNCLIAIANDDYSGMDAEDATATQDGLNFIYRHDGQYVVADGAELGFCWQTCEVCKSLAGDRYKATLVSPEVL